MTKLKPFSDESSRRETTPVLLRMNEIVRGLAGLEVAVQAEQSTKEARAEARYGKFLFDTRYTPIVNERKAEIAAIAASIAKPPMRHAPKAVLPPRKTIIDKPIIIDPLQFEAMSMDIKKDDVVIIPNDSDPVETELRQMIIDTKQQDNRLAEFAEAANKAAMSTGQSYERIAEITK